MPLRIAAALAALLVIVACGDDAPMVSKARDCTWSLGTMGALSGDYASIGQPIFQGIEYAVDEVNRLGELPCRIELHSQDSQGDPNQAPALARGLIDNERLVAVVGPYFSGETLAAGRIFSTAGVAFVTPSASADQINEQGYTTFFRTVADDAIQGAVAAQYIASLGAAKVAVVHDNQDYSKGLADAVSAGLGDAARGPLVINPEETDYSSVVAEVAEMEPDAVFYGGYSPQAGPLARQLRNAGVRALFVSDDGTKDAAFGELAGEGAEGAQVTCPCADPRKIGGAQEFVDGMEAAYDRPPGTFAADAYDAGLLIFAALERVAPDAPIEEVRSEVIQYLHKVTKFEGITKNYTFDETGQVEIGPEGIWVYEWSERDGNFVSIGPASDLIRE